MDPVSPPLVFRSPLYTLFTGCYQTKKNFLQVASANDRALDAITKACDCYKEMRSLYQAGKMLEQAVLLCRDMNQFDKIGGFAERGALLYRQGKATYWVIHK